MYLCSRIQNGSYVARAGLRSDTHSRERPRTKINPCHSAHSIVNCKNLYLVANIIIYIQLRNQGAFCVKFTPKIRDCTPTFIIIYIMIFETPRRRYPNFVHGMHHGCVTMFTLRHRPECETE